MGQSMSDQGVGLRFFVLSCGVWVGGTWACETGNRDAAGATEHRETAKGQVHAGDGEPVRPVTQQVVQRIVAAPNRSESNGVQPAADTAVQSPKTLVEPITSKHLEAELNRLEAELGR